ncbi:MAG: PAS domain S-box protein [bacterium]
MSIRSKLIITFVVVASVPLLFISVLTFNNYKNSLEANRLIQLEDIVAFKTDKIETYFGRLKSEMEIAQSFYNIRKNIPVLSRFYDNPSAPEPISAKKTLDEQLRHIQSILRLFDIMLIDNEGRIIYTSSIKHHAKEISEPFSVNYEKAFTEGKNKIYFSDMFLSKTESGKPAMLVTAPARDLDGGFAGVIAFEVDMAPMYEIIRDVTGLGNTGETLIGKKINNHVVFLNPLRHDMQAAITRQIRVGEALGGPIQEAVKGKFGSGRLIDYRGKKVIAAWRHIPALDWGIVSKIDADEAFADAVNLRNTTIVILAIIFVLGVVMAFPIARSISGPIKRLSIGAEIIGGGNLDYKVSDNSKDEIGQLSRAFDKMTSDLKKTIASRDELDREIATRKKLEESLKLAALKYSTILQTSQSGYVLSDMEGKILEVNDAYCLMTGYSKDELLKMRIKDFEANEKPEEVLAQINSVREKGHLRFERRNRRKDGTFFEIEISTTYLNVEGGLMVAFIQDITERKKAEQLLRNSQIETARNQAIRTERQRLYNVLETLPIYVVLLTKDYHVPFANRFFRERFGESRGKRCFEYLFNRSEACEICETYSVLKTNAPHHWEWTGPDNRNYDIYDYPFTDSDGSTLILEMGIDITDIKKAQEALKKINETLEQRVKERAAALLESEKRLNRAQEISHLGGWELDIVNNRLSWSDEVYRIFGFKPREFAATYEAFLDAVHPADRAAVDAAYSGSIREGRDTYEIEHRIVKKSNGEIRFVHEKCEHIRDASGKIIRSVGMVHDITERKKSEDALKRANENLEQFAYVASHDLQEPLRTMSSYSQLLSQRYKTKLDSDADDFINFITDAAGRMQKLIVDLLAYSRIGRVDTLKEDVDCNSVLGKVVTILSSVIEETGTVITNDPLPVSVCSESNFIQLFQNLISNAIKFRGKNAPHIHISAKKHVNEWLFSVRDNGIGIDEKYRDKIFLIFQRLHGRDKYPGTGIGLSICKKIVETHGGRIWVESQVGKGSTFYFTIPANKQETV